MESLIPLPLGSEMYGLFPLPENMIIKYLNRVRFDKFTNDEDITNSGGEGVTIAVLDVDNVKATRVSLTGHDGTHSASVTSSSDHAQVARVELDMLSD